MLPYNSPATTYIPTTFTTRPPHPPQSVSTVTTRLSQGMLTNCTYNLRKRSGDLQYQKSCLQAKAKTDLNHCWHPFNKMRCPTRLLQVQPEKSQLHRGLRVGDVTGEEATAIRPKGEMGTVLYHLATLLASICAELNRPVAAQTQTEKPKRPILQDKCFHISYGFMTFCNLWQYHQDIS